MNFGFLDGGTAAHKFGHAIGLAHEHQNPRGGIEWNEHVVIAGAGQVANFWDEATTRHNVLRKYASTRSTGRNSIRTRSCSISFPPSWTLNGIATKANEVLSTIDKQFIAGAKMYPKTGGTTATAASSKSTPAPHRRIHRQIRRRGSVPLSPPRATAGIRSIRAVPPTSL